MVKYIYDLTYKEIMGKIKEDDSLNYLRPIKDMRPFKGLNNALTVWDMNNEEYVVKLTEHGFVSWRAVGQELFDNNHGIEPSGTDILSHIKTGEELMDYLIEENKQ